LILTRGIKPIVLSKEIDKDIPYKAKGSGDYIEVDFLGEDNAKRRLAINKLKSKGFKQMD